MNNAGTEKPHPPFEATPMELWREMYETNVFGLIEVTRRAIPALRAGGGGVLCNVTSSSILAPVPFYAPYRSSKAAVSAIGESLRAELAPLGIRVLEIMPGPIDTDMLAGSDRAPEAIDFDGYREVAERYYEGRQSIEGQITSTADAANAIADAILDDDAPLRVALRPARDRDARRVARRRATRTSCRRCSRPGPADGRARRVSSVPPHGPLPGHW